MVLLTEFGWPGKPSSKLAGDCHGAVSPPARGNAYLWEPRQSGCRGQPGAFCCSGLPTTWLGKCRRVFGLKGKEWETQQESTQQEEDKHTGTEAVRGPRGPPLRHQS